MECTAVSTALDRLKPPAVVVAPELVLTLSPHKVLPMSANSLLRRLFSRGLRVRPTSPIRREPGSLGRPVELLEERTVLNGVWTPLVNHVPDPVGAQSLILLSDGTVMVQGGSDSASNDWYDLAPDSSGNYVDGTFSTLAPMSLQRLFFPSNVLPSGKVFVFGGEYTDPNTDETEDNTGEIYNPISNTWTTIAQFPQPLGGDDPTMVLSNGLILVGNIIGPQTYLYNPTLDTWTQTGDKLNNDTSTEETDTLLPDGSVLAYSISASINDNKFEAQRYIPSTGQWVDASKLNPANPPGQLSIASDDEGEEDYEIGPAVVLHNGDVFQTGATGNTALYDPTTNEWSAGPVIPNGLVTDDAPGAILPNGDYIFAVDTPLYTAPARIDEYNPTTNTITDITPGGTLGNELANQSAFLQRMLVLPNGHVLMSLSFTGSTLSNTQLWDYNPFVTADPSLAPTVTTIAPTGTTGEFLLTGTQLTGVSAGASFGDDAESDSNYPIVELTNGNGIQLDARTTNWIPSVQTGSAPATTDFTLPSGDGPGAYLLNVSAAGITTTTGTLFIDMGKGANNLTLEVDPLDSAQVLVMQGTTLIGTFQLASFNQIMVVGDSGNDLLTVNEANGDPIPAGGMTYNGYGGTDKLQVDGGQADSVTYTPSGTVTGTGTITTSTGTITFTALSDVDISGMITATMTYPNSGNIVNVANGFDSLTGTIPALVVTGTSGGKAFIPVSFWDNTNLVLDTSQVAGTDKVTVASANNAHDNTNLTITTGNQSTDTISFTGPATVTGVLTLITDGTATANVAAAVVSAADLVLGSTGNTGVYTLSNPSNAISDLVATTTANVTLNDTVSLEVDTSTAALMTLTGTNVTSPTGDSITTTSGLNVSITGNASLFAGSIDGIGGLTLQGGGTLALTGTNSYSTTTITAATLQIGNGGTTGTLGLSIVSDGGSLVFDRSDDAQVVAQMISGGGSVTQTGGGATTLSGANTYSGGTTISQGTILIGNASALGSGMVTLNDTNTGAANTSLLSTISASDIIGPSITNNIVVANLGTGTTTIGTTSINNGVSDSSDTAFTGTLTLNKATTLTGGNFDHTAYDGTISGSVGTITVTGGEQTTFNTDNSFIGNVVVSGAGTILEVDSGVSLPSTTSLSLGDSTTFQMGASETIDALTGSGTVQNSSGSNSLTVGSNNGSGVFTGVIQDGSNPLVLFKQGSGTETLKGVNTYSGSTVILDGSLLVDGDDSAAIGDVGVDGGILGGTGTVGGAVTVSTGGTITGGTLGGIGTLTVGSLTFDGGTYAADFNGNTSDTIVSDGAVDLANTTQGVFLVNSENGVASVGTNFTLIHQIGSGAIADAPLAGAVPNQIVTIEGTTGQFTYTGGAGNDFTFITIVAPTADSQSLLVAENSTNDPITLVGTDPNMPPLPITYSFTQPLHGTVSGTAPNVTYTPTVGYFGPDSFTFTVNNGYFTSGPATVSITVVAIPVANSQTVKVGENTTSNAITLTGMDLDTPPIPLTYIVTQQPAHGTLSGTAPNLTYTPTTGYFGSDSFQFTDSNGPSTSAPATVSITVVGIPTANAGSATLAEDATHVSVKLTGSDPNTPTLPLTYTVTVPPAHGTLTGTLPNLFYTPTPGYFGSDNFQFTDTNGTTTSGAATYTLTIVGTPTVIPASVTLAENTASVPITLSGFDPNTPARPLTYHVTVPPSHGTLTGTAPNLTYTPTPGYFGTDTFQFTDTNGVATSSAATITLTIVGTPTANPQTVTLPENDSGVPVTLTGSDPNSPTLALTYAVTVPPSHGTLSGSVPNLTYTPTVGYFGTDTFQFTVSNGTATATPATVSLAVIGFPTANSGAVTLGEDTSSGVQLTGTDPNTPPLALSYTVTVPPSHGTLSGTAPNLTYTPTLGYFGTDSFQFTVTNGVTTSGSATESITVIGTPLITGIVPSTINGVIGGSTVTITGINLGAATGVSFGGMTPVIQSITPTTITLTVPTGTPGTVNVTVSNAGGTSPTSAASQFTYSNSINLVGVTQYAVGSDPGGPDVATLFNPDGSVSQTYTPFPGTTGGLRTVVGDFSNDGASDVAFGTGPGQTAEVKVIDGKTGAVLFDVRPFGTFTGGVFVAAGSITGDGLDSLVITPDQGGGPRVEIYAPVTFTEFANFYGINDSGFRGGARAAVGDINGDGYGDLVVAAGFEGGPRISVYDGKALTEGQQVHLVGDFFAYSTTLRNGSYVAVGDVNGDGHADIIIGAGPGGGPEVEILNGETLLTQGAVAALADPLANFYSGDPNNRGGVRVAVKNLDNSGDAGLVTGPGDGGGSGVQAYDGASLAAGSDSPTYGFVTYPGYVGGIYVG